jgi:hypothetical protein
MAGKKGGILSSVGNAIGSGKYLFDPLGSSVEDQARKQRNVKAEIKQEIETANAQQAAAEAEMANQKTLEDQSFKQQSKRRSQKALSLSKQGRSGTILTSPLGEAGGGQSSGKTLLGE